jgi:hypothetical protein
MAGVSNLLKYKISFSLVLTLVKVDGEQAASLRPGELCQSMQSRGTFHLCRTPRLPAMSPEFCCLQTNVAFNLWLSVLLRRREKLLLTD